MGAPTFTVMLQGEQAVPYTEATLMSLAKTLIAQRAGRKMQPLLIRDEISGTKLYYNEHSLLMYIDGRMTIREVLDSSWCHGLYRNKVALRTQHENVIDPDSLWLLRDTELILVDGDEFHTCNFNTVQQLFTQIA